MPRGAGEGELDLQRLISVADQKSMSLATCYAVVAAEEALTHAGWKPESDHDCNRTGTKKQGSGRVTGLSGSSNTFSMNNL